MGDLGRQLADRRQPFAQHQLFLGDRQVLKGLLLRLIEPGVLQRDDELIGQDR